MREFLIYGATGYTGQLAAEHAVAIGLRPVLAGRSPARLEPLAKRLGLEWRAFGLETPEQARAGVNGMAAVLHAAGPFSVTSRAMADACLSAGAHYCDITGEIDVFEALAANDARAKAAGVMLLPGAGFDVVPSDCLAAHVAARMPDATRLRLSIGGLTALSRGTAKTMLKEIARPTRVRRGGHIFEQEDAPHAMADFGAGPRRTIGMSWGDVSTAGRSTRIPNIAVFFEASRELEWIERMPRLFKRIIATGFAQRLITRQIDKRMPPGPTAEQRSSGRAVIVAEAWNAAGERVASRLETPEPYLLTVRTAVEIVRRAASGHAPPGYQTPSTAYGADFIMQFERVTRVDL